MRDLAVEVWRDLSLAMANGVSDPIAVSIIELALRKRERERMPELREGVTCQFRIASFVSEGVSEERKFYLTTGCYPDGRLGELFVKCDKQDAPFSKLLDMWAIAFSIALQRGTPLGELCEKFAWQGFEPSGRSSNPEIGHAASPIDFIARWLLLKFDLEGKPK